MTEHSSDFRYVCVRACVRVCERGTVCMHALSDSRDIEGMTSSASDDRNTSFHFTCQYFSLLQTPYYWPSQRPSNSDFEYGNYMCIMYIHNVCICTPCTCKYVYTAHTCIYSTSMYTRVCIACLLIVPLCVCLVSSVFFSGFSVFHTPVLVFVLCTHTHTHTHTHTVSRRVSCETSDEEQAQDSIAGL